MSVELFKKALRDQETTDGTHKNTYVLNEHEAFGKYQITAKTFKGMQRNGDIPADWIHTNREHADQAGDKHAEMMFNQYGGNTTLAAAAFYGGPKSVRNGQVVSYRDLKNPHKAPDTVRYANEIQQRLRDLGITATGEALPDPVGVEKSGSELINTPFPGPLGPRPTTPKAGATTPVAGPTPVVPAAPVAGTVGDAITSIRAEQRERKGVVDGTSFLDTARAQTLYGGVDLLGVAVRKVADAVMTSDWEADPAYVRDASLYEGKTAEEQQELFVARSSKEEQYIHQMQLHRKESEDVIARSGTVQGLAAGFVAGLPTGIVAGAAAARTLARAGMGSLTLAQAGRGGAAVGSSVAENAGAGLLQTAAVDLLDGHTSIADYGVGVLMDTALSGLTAPGLMNTADSARYLQTAQAALQEQAAKLQAAQVKLGEGAPKEAVQKEVQRQEANEVAAATTHAPAGERVLISEETNDALVYGNVVEDAPEAKAADAPPVFSGTLDTVHGSAAPITALRPMADMADADRYDGTGGEFGRGFYSAEDNWWFRGADIRMSHLQYATDVSVPLDNALLLTPETVKSPWMVQNGPEIFGKFTAEDGTAMFKSQGIEDRLLALGFDGVVVRGFKDEDGDLLNQVVSFKPERVSVKGDNPALTPLLTATREAQAELDAAVKALPADLQGYPADLLVREYGTGNFQGIATLTKEDHSKLQALLTKRDDARAAVRAASEAPEVKAYSQADADLEARTKAATDAADKVATLDSINQQSERLTNYVPDTAPQHVRDAANAAMDLAQTFLPDHVRLGVVYTPGQAVSGFADTSGPAARIGLSDIGTANGKGLQIAVHEVTHVMNAYYLPNYVNKADLLRDYGEFLETVRKGDLEKAARMRWASKESLQVDPTKRYDLDFDEWVAEQAAKYSNELAAQGGNIGVREGLVATLRAWADRVFATFAKSKAKGYIPAAQSVKDYLEAVRAREVQPVKFARPVRAAADTVVSQNAWLTSNPIAQKYGLDLLPVGSASERAHAKAMLALYTKADGYPMPDEKRINSILANSPFADATVQMLRSENPVVRMAASELLESASGATKRQSTAAIGKFVTERKIVGSSLVEFEALYNEWSRKNGGSLVKDVMDGKHWRDFNTQVMEYIEGGKQGSVAPEVAQAAEKIEAAFDRMRVEQINAKALGYKALPTTSKGYVPHRMNVEALRNMSAEQTRILHSALTDQFIEIEGFDMTFADALASRYIETIRKRGVGGFASSVTHGAADIDALDEALGGMGLSAQETYVLRGKLRAGSAGHTKTRLKLDLLKEYPLADGSTFRLLNVFDTDLRALVRSQAGRVGGEVALAKHGILGKPGLQLMRDAMGYGDVGSKAQPNELEAFDQVASEFLNQPFAQHTSKVLDRVMLANTAARLGGMAFPQLGETLNGIAHLGVARALSFVPEFARLRSEAIALARGEKIDNPILSTLESHGAIMGGDNYQFSFPFEDADQMYQAYGRDTLTATDRLLRGAVHVQSKLSFWRALHAVQQRGMAEQVVRKALRYLRDGGDDAALNDMGFGPELQAALRADLPYIATFEGDELVKLDLTQATNLTAVEDFVHAVHRGTNQIIQGTFIGERGKWAHEGWLRFLTQFRSFSLVSVEKQWTRQMNNHGPWKGTAILVGSMMMASPIYMARVAVNSIGREDQEEYLEKMLHPAMVARASLNYIAMSGLAPDFIDAFTAVTGLGEVTGARSGVASGFVGNVLAPGAGWIDDVWKGVQNTQDGTDPTALAKTLPLANLPYLAAGVRALAE